jgi:hypothetical protein
MRDWRLFAVLWPHRALTCQHGSILPSKIDSKTLLSGFSFWSSATAA